MNVLNYIFALLTRVFTYLVLIITIYYLCISFFGLYRKKESDEAEPEKSFAVIVAAHNEEAVISDIVSSLNKLDYPKELYDVFVIADNCNDKTATLAREKGALVYERTSKDKRGKGFALEWMFAQIFKLEKKYDAVVIFDADNLVSKNFLREMNKKLCEGFKVVQGYLDSKNPHDTWIAGCYSIGFWANNRMFQLARSNMGVSSQLGGTGCCIDVEVLKKLGWGATCLTEDLEFSCKLVLNGYRVGWAHEAIVYDEKPLTLMQSWWQRKRWMQGYADVSGRYFFKLLKKGIKERSFTAIDCAIYSIQPVLFIIIGLTMILGVTSSIFNVADVITGKRTLFSLVTNNFSVNLLSVIGLLFAIFETLYTPVLLFIDKKISLKIVVYYIFMPFYVITWLPISIQGFIDRNKKDWSHTAHTRSMDITDLEKAN